MNYELSDLLDLPLIQNLQEKLDAIYSFPSAIIDNEGRILTAVAWQDICTKFHRRHPVCEKECIKSDRYILEHIHEANPCISYQCPHGLCDNAVPIVIDGKHLGNFFTGQFFHEKPDLEFFKNQAQQYGFDEKEYLEAVRKVPIWTREKLNQYIDFIKSFIGIITSIALKNLKETAVNEALKESQERYVAIIQSTFDWIWEVDKDGRYVYCSEKVEKILGYTADEILGKTPFDLMPLTEVEMVRSTFMDIIRNRGAIVDLENWNLHKNGSLVCLLTNGAPILGKNGELTGYRGADKDITERKIAEKALRDSEEYSNQLFDASPDGMVIIGKDGRIMRANIAQVKMYGYEYADEMVGIHATQLITPASRDFSNKILNRRLSGEYIPAIEYELVKKDGTTFYGETLAANLKDADGVISGYICVTRDISERKYTELELIKAKEKAEESDRLKSAFLANMSHEIRTPMNGILGFTSLLKEANLTAEDSTEYINIIEKSGARLLNIINDIVSISKVESGQMTVAVGPANVNQHLDYIYKFFKPEAEQLGLRLILRNPFQDPDLILETDSEKLYAILTNLVKNALKFTYEGAIEIGCNLKHAYSKSNEKRDPSSSEIEFFVKDTGVGIGEEQKEFIFERFRQGSESLNRNYEGAGLGLSISKAYVEMLGGKIWVESTLGKGSVFYFTLPIENSVGKPETIIDAGSDEDQKNQYHPGKILIAEDDETSEKYLKHIVRSFGREILTARNGEEAVKMCYENNDIDLILMDIKMPLMDGYEATRQIRQFNNNVVIIAQTAFALAGDHEQAIIAGCNDSISKPIQKDKLIRLVHQIFNPEVAI